MDKLTGIIGYTMLYAQARVEQKQQHSTVIEFTSKPKRRQKKHYGTHTNICELRNRNMQKEELHTYRARHYIMMAARQNYILINNTNANAEDSSKPV
ncbi:MAG: hypothetical protein A2W17_06210 [Planctomycetes bacterium RBG_16_41_13]|nr:MAG: hypothetical protein A2W17_06210 [Planctomycetes bacterium RBG_16_41_13]